MADWKEQYLAALEARDEVEKANVDLYDYCARLADERAGLLKQLSQSSSQSKAIQAPSPPPPLIGYGFGRVTSPPPVTETDTVLRLRQELATAQQERADVTARLEAASAELEVWKKKSRIDQRKVVQLSSNQTQMTTKLRDREEELKGKTKLLVDVQDDNVTLTLQLNMAEDQVQKLRKENQELVDRWMTRMGSEAEKMNREGNFQ